MLDGAESSFLDLRDPSHLDFEYHQQMDAVLAALRGEGGPLRALHLGGAGCALARAWDVTHPGSQQVGDAGMPAGEPRGGGDEQGASFPGGAPLLGG